MKYGENITLTDIQRQMAKAAWAQNEALWTRFIEGKPAMTMLGEAVTPEYNDTIHRTAQDVTLDPMPEVLMYRFWDGGLNPTCVFMQITPRGYWNITDTIRGDNIGMKQLIQSRIKPLLAARYSLNPHWRDIGDPSLANREQSNSDHSGARVIEELLQTRFEKGAVMWEPRREAAKQTLSWMIDGEPMVRLSYHENILHRAFRGGWHYVKDISGKVIRDKAKKDVHSHPGDAYSYGAEKIFGVRKPSYADIEKIEAIEKQLVMSYA